jgi:hypothetical protein
MELYTLDNQFRPQMVLDTILTSIWTERYTKVGDLAITAEPTVEMQTLLAEGTFIQARGSNEVAQIDTFLIENGILKVTGNMITDILDDRIIRGPVPAVVDPPVAEPREYSIADSPENVIAQLVTSVIVAGGSLVSVIPNGDKQVITNLSVDPVTTTSTSVQFSIPYGSLLSAIGQIADTYSVGFKMYLASVSDSAYSLAFKVYRGRDLTSSQTANPVVKFSPAMDTLTNLKKLSSVANYKTAAYVYGSDNGTHPPPGVAIIGPSTAIDFDRRVIMAEASDITMDVAGGSTTTFQQMLDQRAKDTLANNNYTKVIDGEIVPQSQYQYGIDYFLGDVIELDSGDGYSSKARITEYIRSQDQSGERAYPTVSVI